MGDDDMIRRGDALKIALAYASGEGGALAEHAIRAIPAADARAEVLKEAGDAWAAYKAANTTVAHWEAVARLDAALIPETKP